MKQLICAVLLVSVCLYDVTATLCNSHDAEFNECVRKTLQDNIGKLSKEGLKSIGFPRLDPFYVPELLITFDDDNVRAKSLTKNSYTHGVKDIKFLGFRSNLDDPNDIKMEIDFTIPKVFIEGTYKTEGKFVQVLITGKGVYNISMTNVSGTAKVNAHLVKKGGEEYLLIDKVGMRPTVGTMRVYASNLINGNPELSALSLNVVNQYWRVLYEAMLPFVEVGFDKILRGRANQFTMKVPYNKIINTE